MKKLKESKKCVDTYNRYKKLHISWLGGYYSSDDNEIGILVWDLLNKENLLSDHMIILLTLYHEMQHAIQHREGPHKRIKKLAGLTESQYENYWIEVDANQFAVDQIIKNYDAIQYISEVKCNCKKLNEN